MGVEDIIEIVRIPFWVIILIFVGYIGSHAVLIAWYKHVKEQIVPDKEQLSALRFWSKWWHVAYAIGVIIFFMVK